MMTQASVLLPPSRPSPFRDLARDLAAGRRDPGWLQHRCEAVDARRDLADHKLLTVVKLYLSAGDLLRSDQRERIERSALGFKYHWTEPGADSMCTWSESHQLVFAVCEYLMGQAFPDRRFTNDGRTGHEKRMGAEARLRGWLEDRFRHGFSEWLSNTYYEIAVVGLSVLIDHCHDADLVERASMVLDLVMLDIALHSFHDRLATSAGRAYANQMAYPARAEVDVVLRDAFVEPQPFDPDALASLFVGRDRYRLPAVLQQIHDAEGEHEVRTSTGIDLGEVEGHVARRRHLDDAGRRDAELRLLWGAEAFTTPEGIGPTLDEIRRTSVRGNSFLSSLRPFLQVRSRRLAIAMLKAVNPVTAGAALRRANVLTIRSPHYLLSSAQHYRPGEFGDQQHIWHAALPGDIQVFATHPGASRLSDLARPATPTAWVGNGINPDVAQVGTTLLALYDTRSRAGYLEGHRHELSHLYFPFSAFDETQLSEHHVVGRRGDSFIGITSVNPLQLVSEYEVVQRGAVTGWAVVVGDRSTHRSLQHMAGALREASLTLRAGTLAWRMPTRTLELTWRRGLRVDGVAIDTEYARYDCEWATVPRLPTVVRVQGPDAALRLDWNRGLREELPADSV